MHCVEVVHMNDPIHGYSIAQIKMHLKTEIVWSFVWLVFSQELYNEKALWIDDVVPFEEFSSIFEHDKETRTGNEKSIKNLMFIVLSTFLDIKVQLQLPAIMYKQLTMYTFLQGYERK